MKRWFSEYIDNIDLTKIEWISFNCDELKKFYEDNYLLGLVLNNIGKKTIVSAMVYTNNCFVCEEQEEPLTYIYSVETNRYFFNKGIYTKLCNEVIKYINMEQHIIISDESEMGRELRVIDKLRDIFELEQFE